MNEKLGKKQYLVPYLMSSHPGSDYEGGSGAGGVSAGSGLYAGAGAGLLSDAVHHFHLHVLHRDMIRRTMEPVYVPTNPHEKAMQRALIQYRNPKNYDLVVEALTRAPGEPI